MTPDMRHPALRPEQASAPHMVFVNAVKTGLQRFADFSGRANRREFWGFFLFYVLGTMGLARIEAFHTSLSALTALFALIFLLPMLAVLVRRLHDTGRSGYWAFFWLLPIAGPLVIFAMTAQPGTQVAPRDQ